MEVTSFKGKLEKFEVVMDSDSEYIMVGKRQFNGDWPWYAVIRLQYLAEYMPKNEMPAEYSVDVLAVSPSAAGKDNCEKALDCIGVDRDYPITEDVLLDALLSYGTYATLWSKTGNNKRGLLRKAKENATALNMMFGFAMDAPQNRIGATGWDFIAGEIMPRKEVQEA